jgi:uncharacterized membrane protein YidH (DUF202 family)
VKGREHQPKLFALGILLVTMLAGIYLAARATGCWQPAAWAERCAACAQSGCMALMPWYIATIAIIFLVSGILLRSSDADT